jgi:hypothetical protein
MASRTSKRVSRIEDLNDPFELLGLELADGALRKRFLNLKHQMSKDRGLLCFSRAWTNPVQWSHYVDLHRGVCLGFEVSPGLPIPVEYSARRLAPEAKQLLTGPITKETMRRVLSTKYSHWKYEPRGTNLRKSGGFEQGFKGPLLRELLVRSAAGYDHRSSSRGRIERPWRKMLPGKSHSGFPTSIRVHTRTGC